MFDTKWDSLQQHRSQVPGFGGQEKLSRWFRSLFADAAKGSGYELAEAFHRVVAPP